MVQVQRTCVLWTPGVRHVDGDSSYCNYSQASLSVNISFPFPLCDWLKHVSLLGRSCPRRSGLHLLVTLTRRYRRQKQHRNCNFQMQSQSSVEVLGTSKKRARARTQPGAGVQPDEKANTILPPVSTFRCTAIATNHSSIATLR